MIKKICFYLILITLFMLEIVIPIRFSNRGKEAEEIALSTGETVNKYIRKCVGVQEHTDIDYEGLEMYRPILVGYERAWEDGTYTEEKWEQLYDLLAYCKNTPVYYSLKDLTDNGTPELILGELSGGQYYPQIIYSYDGGEIVWSIISENNLMTIYENGFVELAGSGTTTYYMYHQFQKNTGKPQYLMSIYKMNGEGPCFRETKEITEEITEEEYQNIKNEYAAVPVELNWKPLEGFWKPESELK